MILGFDALQMNQNHKTLAIKGNGFLQSLEEQTYEGNAALIPEEAEWDTFFSTCPLLNKVFNSQQSNSTRQLFWMNWGNVKLRAEHE